MSMFTCWTDGDFSVSADVEAFDASAAAREFVTQQWEVEWGDRVDVLTLDSNGVKRACVVVVDLVPFCTSWEKEAEK